MKLVVSLLILAVSSLAVAQENTQACSNFAKYEAIRKYKADTGTVQGSDGIEYSAQLLKETSTQYQYVVEISDNNEDGEYWTLAYTVTLEKKTCKKVSISEPEVVSASGNEE